MKNRDELIEAIRTLVDVPQQVILGEVTSVDTGSQIATIKLDESGNVTYDVRLKAIIDNNQNGFVVFPKTGAKLLAAKIYNNDDYVMLTCSENSEVWINGKENGDLINISEITNKLNNLVSEVDSLKQWANGHAHPSNGSPPGTTFTGSFSSFNEDDYNDEKVKH
jgi:hypothetical protein